MNRPLDKHLSNIVVLLAIIGYFDLFAFSAIPSSIRQIFKIGVAALLFILIVVHIIYKPGNKVKMNFALPILLMIIASLPSYITASAFHNQSFMVSAFANRLIWFYLLYFYLHFYQVSIRYILKLIVIIGSLVMCLFFLQYIMYPNTFLDIYLRETRGTIRLFVPGMLLSQAAYFYFLNRFFSKHSIISLAFALLIISMYVLQGTRAFLFSLAFLTLMNLLFSTRVKSRFAIILIVSLSFVSIFFIFREIFIELTHVSTNQANKMGEGVRLKAASFFLTRFMPNGLAYVFGNGVPGPGSAYGVNMAYYSMRFGYYLSDIGIIGDYVKYGVFFVIGGLLMILKALFFPVSPVYSYLKYYILFQCFTMITGKGLFSGVDVVLLLILYVFDVDRDESIKVKNEVAEKPS